MISRGEIYEVQFGDRGGSVQRGLRPALVIQSDSGNEFSSTTIVAAMTTRTSTSYDFRVIVPPRNSGLRQPSAVMLDQLHTIDQARLGKRVGRLSQSALEEVDRALHYSLGLLSCPTSF